MAELISDKYEILSKVGQGGMGAVYKARHTALDTIVALKQLPPDVAEDADLRARFRREAQVMAQFRHENIVKVFDILEEGRVYYLVEEFVDGQDLRQYIRRRGYLPVVEALEIACQIARALAYAHKRGVIHRDVKPSNILIESTVPVRALLVDFGIAKVEDAGDGTLTGTYLGSPKYSAPEQLGYGRRKSERSRVDGRTDVFSLGLVIFEMCEGRQFFADLEPYDIIGRVVYDSEPLTPTFSRFVPPPLRGLVSRAIHREPEQRHQSMGDLLRDLETCLRALTDEDRETVAVPPTPSAPTGADGSEDQRLALERERERQQALAAQERARVARENAGAADAPRLASQLYRQATAQQEEGSATLRDSRYLRACELLEGAAGAFREAAAAAGAGPTIRDAEAARLLTCGTRELAEHESAADNASPLYGRAVGKGDGLSAKRSPKIRITEPRQVNWVPVLLGLSIVSAGLLWIISTYVNPPVVPPPPSDAGAEAVGARPPVVDPRATVAEHLTLANFYLDRGEYNEAISELEAAVRINSHDDEVNSMLARARRARDAEQSILGP